MILFNISGFPIHIDFLLVDFLLYTIASGN